MGGLGRPKTHSERNARMKLRIIVTGWAGKLDWVPIDTIIMLWEAFLFLSFFLFKIL